jgi:hypothetical protein
VFDIRLLPEIPIEMDEGQSLMWGSLQIADFREDFVVSLFDWTPVACRQQWREAAERLVKGEPKSAFVTSFVPPTDGSHFEWWTCYGVKEIVYVQNQLRFYEQLASPFNLDSLYDYVADRKTVSEDDGSPISEWQMPVQWMRDFLIQSAGEGR